MLKTQGVIQGPMPLQNLFVSLVRKVLHFMDKLLFCLFIRKGLESHIVINPHFI